MLLLALPLAACGEDAPEVDFTADTSIPYARSETETNFVQINVRDFGTIVVELYPDTAPITVENFKGLVAESFYDGLIFHRIISGFMIQGGGITEDYKEKDCPSIKGEFASNGVENNLRHTRGVISMARTSVPDSASSQFFICNTRDRQYIEHLDGLYAAFGWGGEGMEVIDAITVKTATPSGKVDPEDRAVIEKMTIINYEK